MISWEEFLSQTVTAYRKEFNKLSKRSQKLIKEKEFHNSLLRPCQIEVLDAGEKKTAVWLVVHDNNLPDMMFKIHKNVKDISVSQFLKKYEFLTAESLEKVLTAKYSYHEIYMKDTMSGFRRDVEPQYIGNELLRWSAEPLFEQQYNIIESGTDGLKKSIAKISEVEIRDELLATTKRIDASLQEIRRLDKEIGEVRKLVGVTKEIQDWRLLFTDVGRLKDEHVPKQVFDAKIERLDEKIEKGLENLNKRVDEGVKALNTRIEDLKAIKFWSKRTLLEIALAILAIISTLFATEILKF